MTSKVLKVIGVGVVASASSALAGGFSAISPNDAPILGSGAGDWAKSLKDIGTVYKNKKNPYIQEVKFFGRVHHQFSYVDGDVDGDNFSGDGDELRRLRFGTSIKFLNGFKLNARANFERGGFRQTTIDYNGFEDLTLQYDFGDVGVIENLKVGYGRYKIGFGGEEAISSKHIKTIERSNLNNFFSADRSTGVRFEFDHGAVDYTFGVFSTTEADGRSRLLAGWDDGIAYMLSAEFEALGGEMLLQALINDTSDSEEDTIGYEWAVSATHETEVGPFDLFTNITVGEDQNNDVAYGVVIMPSVFLVKDKLEAVVRYQYFKGDGDIELSGSSRGFRDTASNNGVIDASGDENHTIYAGLNYYISGQNLKLMTGIEYETVDGGTADSESTTVWGAARFFF